MRRKRISVVFGTRPEAIKMAPVILALRRTPGVECRVCVTAQHRQMLDQVLQIFRITPDVDLDLMRPNQSLSELAARVLTTMDATLRELAPDLLMVQGDTTTVFATSVAAFHLGIPVAHVEAGLRSFNRRMPEEINRVLTDHLSALLLCPTTTAVDNLAGEGIRSGVHNVGDVMFDATLHVRSLGLKRSRILEALGLVDGAYCVLTLHRAENTAEPDRLARLVDYVVRGAGRRPIVFPVHPRTRTVLQALAVAEDSLRTIEPVAYADMHRLLAGAATVFTDSGGLQKEAYFHRVPCVTLREETEWVETVAAGWNRLWSTPEYAPRREIAEYGQGDSAERIVGLIGRLVD